MKFRKQFLTRQLDIIPEVGLGATISIVGSGAVGSFTALSLAKMGFHNLTVYDFDVVSEENMNCQFFKVSDIGRKKIEALKDLILEFTGVEITTVDAKLDSSSVLMSDIVIFALDSMEARSTLFNMSACNYLIDPRMSAEYASMRVVDMRSSSSRKAYEKSLYSDSESVQERCTAKSTMYTVNLLAGQICKAVKDIATNNSYIKNLDWNIKNNNILAFNSLGGKL